VLLALREDSPPVALDPVTLETLGNWDFHGTLPGLMAVAKPSKDTWKFSRICSSDFESRSSQGVRSASWHHTPSSFYSDGRHRLHYWQTRSRAEVDFIVYGESGIHAIEVKNSRKVESEALRALKSFGEDYPQTRAKQARPASAMDLDWRQTPIKDSNCSRSSLHGFFATTLPPTEM
jgi:hypothetical protein